jgi:ABC-2 type transport system ATP-binding protein
MIRDHKPSRRSAGAIYRSEELCSQLLILNEGRLVASGAVNDVMRAAIVERAAQIRVPTNLIERARQAIGELPGLTTQAIDGRPDLLRIALQTGAASPEEPDERLNAAVVAVAAANVPVLSYEVEGARLSDAFLQMTRKAAS